MRGSAGERQQALDREARRRAALRSWGWDTAAIAPLAGDASFRRYFRLVDTRGTRVLMDAPPPDEDVRPFVAVAGLLAELGFSAPAVLAADAEAGFLLLEDLGDATYARALAEGAEEADLYGLAVDTLASLHERFGQDERFGRAGAGSGQAGYDLPDFTGERMIAEAMRLPDWVWPAMAGTPPPGHVRDEWVAAWRAVLACPLGVPTTLVLFDFHIDNLVWLRDRPGIAACGLLDFQDAVRGPAPFDLVSLLEDVRRDVPAGLAAAMRERYLAARPDLDPAAFARAYAICGAQRNSRIAGTFMRLWLRNGKPGYLRHLPRTWRLLEGDVAHPALAPVRAWLDRHVPAAWRVAPEPGAPIPGGA